MSTKNVKDIEKARNASKPKSVWKGPNLSEPIEGFGVAKFLVASSGVGKTTAALKEENSSHVVCGDHLFKIVGWPEGKDWWKSSIAERTRFMRTCLMIGYSMESGKVVLTTPDIDKRFKSPHVQIDGWMISEEAFLERQKSRAIDNSYVTTIEQYRASIKDIESLVDHYGGKVYKQDNFPLAFDPVVKLIDLKDSFPKLSVVKKNRRTT